MIFQKLRCRKIFKCWGSNFLVGARAAITIIAIVTLSLPGQSKSYDELFMQVFGRLPEKQYFNQQMALVVDGQFVDDGFDVRVPSVGSDYQLFSYPLLNYLVTVQKQGTVQGLTKKIDENGRLSIADIQSEGYKIVVDRRSFTVFVEVPPHYRKKIVYYIMGEPEPPLGSASPQLRSPAKWSGFINYSFSTSYTRLGHSTNEKSSQDNDFDTSEGDVTNNIAVDTPASGLELPLGSFYGITKTGPYSLHYSGAFDLSAVQKFNMGNLTLQRDYGEHNKRWMVGQVSPFTKGSQVGLSLLGVGVTSGPVLNQIGNFSPKFKHTLQLDYDSTIEVYINFKKVKEFNLVGGVYELRGFPLRTGFNVIKIVVISNTNLSEQLEDGVYNDVSNGMVYRTKPAAGESHVNQAIRLHRGRQSTNNWLIKQKISKTGMGTYTPPEKQKVMSSRVFLFSVDPVLLDPSYFEWHYSVGNPMSWNGFQPQTQNELTHSVYLKKGLNPLLTSTVYAQYNALHTLLGNEIYASVPFGSLFLNNAFKKTVGVSKWGNFSRASFITYPIYSSPNQWFKLLNIGISAGFRSPEFLAFGASRPVIYDNTLFEVSGSVSYQFKYLFSGSMQISKSQAITGNTEGNTRQFSIIFQRSLPFGFGLSASFQDQVGQEVIDPKILKFKVSWSGFDGLSTASTLKQTVATQDIQTDIAVQKDFFESSLNTGATAHHSSEKKSVGLSLNYKGHSSNFSLTDSAIQSDQQFGYILNNQRFNSNVALVSRRLDGNQTQMVSLSAESAIAFADGRFGISAPIQESFAVFSADKSLRGKAIYVGDDGKKIDRWGPAVLPALRDRVVTDVLVDVPALSVGAQFDRLHSFQPINFNGYLVELHVTPSVMIMGKLLKSKTSAARYLSGYLVSDTQPELKEKLITSRSGIFQVSNLNPGKYTITFGKKPYHDVSIEIPSDADGLFRIDDIHLVRKEGPNVPQMSNLEEQIELQNTKRKKEDSVTVSTMTLLQSLINDILAEPTNEIPESTPGVSDGAANKISGAVYSTVPGDTLTNAEYLHQLKSEINRNLFKKNEKDTGEKIILDEDSLQIIEKINRYYLRKYTPKQPTQPLHKKQIRSTNEQALFEHKKRSRTMLTPQVTITSNAIERARMIHQQRIKK